MYRIGDLPGSGLEICHHPAALGIEGIFSAVSGCMQDGSADSQIGIFLPSEL